MTKMRCFSTAVMIMIASIGGAAAASSGDLGRTSLEMTRSDGGRARLVFLPRHKLQFQGVKTADVMTGDGTYTISPRQFCYTADFPGHECWALDTPLQVGKTITARSMTDPVTARLTLRDGQDAVIPAKGP